jgi:transposase
LAAKRYWKVKRVLSTSAAMGFLTGSNRNERLLMPDCVDDYVSEDNVARLIDAFVERIELEKCGFQRVKPAETGRPAYSPADLLKLYIWGYFNQVRSSRKLERECNRNLEAIWLMRNLRPDFKTIADFRRDNAKAFKAVLKQFNVLCRKLELFGRELVAIDGSKLKAVNSVARNFKKDKTAEVLDRLNTRLEQYITDLDKADQQEEAEDREQPTEIKNLAQKIEKMQAFQQELEQALEEAEKSGATEVSLTDPESRRMLKVGVGYNGQIAVDDKHHLIVAAEVVQDANDQHQLVAMAQEAKEALETDKLKAVADGGYYNYSDIAQCEKQNIEAYMPRPEKGSAVKDGLYSKHDFKYDAEEDCYHCPGGAKLTRRGKEVYRRGNKIVNYQNAKACRACPLREKCTTSKGRIVSRWEGEDEAERMQQRMETNPEIMKRRKATVEHVFGTMLFWRSGRCLLTKGLQKVRGEFSLHALAYNLTRAINVVGMAALLRALVDGNRLILRSKSGLLPEGMRLWTRLASQFKMFFNPRFLMSLYQ